MALTEGKLIYMCVVLSYFWPLGGVGDIITLWALSKLINEKRICDYSDLFSTL